MDSRELSLDIVIDILEKGKFSNSMINRALNYNGYLEKRERSFITRLCEGTVERKITLDYIISHFSKTAPEKMRPQIRNILRLGVYQLLYMDSVPASAACNESVKLAKKKGFHTLAGFVNGVLRQISRQENLPESLLKEESEITVLSVRYSVPEWIADYYLKHYGIIQAEEILKGYFTDNRISVRCNLSKITPEALRKRLEEEGVAVEPGLYFDYALRLSDMDSITSLKAFQEGLFQVQDESSMFVGHFADITPGMTVLDVCAAPGGKSLHIADKMAVAGGGRVISRDFSEQKLKLINENFERNGFVNYIAEVADATVFDESLTEKADLVICDLPCSGLGIMAKKPDIRYNMTPKNRKELSALQRKILNNAVRYVKPGGQLIYSTCTIGKDENEGNADYIAGSLKLKPCNLTEKMPKGLCIKSSADGYIQLLPGVHGTDGFFISVFRKE